jgi:hypothetical protein
VQPVKSNSTCSLLWTAPPIAKVALTVNCMGAAARQWRCGRQRESGRQRPLTAAEAA